MHHPRMMWCGPLNSDPGKSAQRRVAGYCRRLMLQQPQGNPAGGIWLAFGATTIPILRFGLDRAQHFGNHNYAWGMSSDSLVSPKYNNRPTTRTTAPRSALGAAPLPAGVLSDGCIRPCLNRDRCYRMAAKEGRKL